MIQMQIDVVLLRPNAAPFANLDRHRTGDHIARRQILGVRRVALSFVQRPYISGNLSG
jgi:hypothetical protein